MNVNLHISTTIHKTAALPIKLVKLAHCHNITKSNLYLRQRAQILTFSNRFRVNKSHEKFVVKFVTHYVERKVININQAVNVHRRHIGYSHEFFTANPPNHRTNF